MKRRIVPALALVLAGCIEPPKTSAAQHYADNLRDIYRWDPASGAGGHFAYDVMFSVDPAESVPVLLGKLFDTSPTGIYDQVHDPVPVGNVAFHILLRIFGMRAEDFEREGVWIMKTDPSRNPIYTVKLDSEQVRRRVAERLRRLAWERGWLKPRE